MAYKRYVIQRDVPGLGASTLQQLRGVAQTSNAALAKLANEVQWEHSYVTDDGTFCVYLAENEEAIRRHAELSGFPANRVTLVSGVIDPTTANARA